MKPKLKHMKRNTQTRKDYQKNLDIQKQTREYKKKLLKFIIFYCKANPKIYHEVLLPLFDEGKEELLSKLIRDAWVANNKSIREDQTGFINNSQYLEAIVGHLVDAIPRIHSEEGKWGDYEEELSSNEGDEETDETKSEEIDKKDKEEAADIPLIEVEAPERPKKKQKTSSI